MYNYGSGVMRIITIPLWICLYIICSPIILGIYLYIVCGLNKDNFTCNGFTVHTKTYEYKDNYGRTVVLIPMIHIGSKRFYTNVDEILKNSNMILNEGVNDRKQRLPNPINYDILKDITGLKAQKPFKSTYTVNGDGDISDLSESTIEMLEVLSDILEGGLEDDNIKNNLKKLKKIKNSEIMNDLLDGRNKTLEQSFNSVLSNQDYIKEKITLDCENNKPRDHVDYGEMFETLDKFQQLMPREQHICIPWGAKHTPYFQEMVKKKNFTLITTDKIYVLNILSVFINILLYPMSNK